MASLLIEGGIYFLLFFTPLAFGGVELWAQGVLQIVTGVIVAAWTLLWLQRSSVARGSLPVAARLALAIPVTLFLALVCLQLAPLPPSLLKTLSPATARFYEESVPGYAEGVPLDVASIGNWLLETQRERIPGDDAPVSSATIGSLLTPELPAVGIPLSSPHRRTLTLSPPETKVRLTLLLCCVALFAVTADHFRTKERVSRLMTAAVLSAGAISLFGIIQRLTWNGKLFWLREGAYHNPFGPFVNRNSYAAFAGTIFPIAICMALNALRQVQKGRRDAFPRLLLCGFAAMSMAAGIALSLSRGGLISAGLSVLVIGAMLMYFGRRAMEVALVSAIIAASALLLVWIGPEMVIERVGTLSEGQSIPSFAQRMKAWTRSMEMIADHPLVGAGFGAFKFSFMRYAPPGEGWWTTVHNEYLEVLCDTGFIGAGFAAAGLLVWLILSIRPGRLKGRSERYAWTGITAGIAGLLVHSAISSNLQVPANGVLLSVLAGALLALTARHAPDQESSP